MSLSIYDRTQIASPSFRAFLDVKACLKAVFEGCSRYGKSPCFLRCRILRAFGEDDRVSNLMGVDGAENLD